MQPATQTIEAVPSLMQPPTLEKRSSTLEDPPSQPMDASLAAQGLQNQAHNLLAAQGQGLQNQAHNLQAALAAQGQGAVDTKVQEVQDLAHNLQAAPAAFVAQRQAALTNRLKQAVAAQENRVKNAAQTAASVGAASALGPAGPLVLNLAKSLATKSLVTEGATPPQLTRSNSAKFGGQQGGDDYNDDTLKARYLETRPQRYSKIINDEKTIKKFKDKQIENNRNIEIKTNNKIEQLANDIDVYNALSFEEKKDSQKNKEIIQKIKNFENDPKNPLEELALTFDDRIVFIIATFFIRYVTIIMVQWCIDINIIKSFYEGFIYYAIIYIILFWFIVLFINIDNSFDVKYMNFNGIINSIRTLFYYFYMGTNGISRLLIHTSLILILIVIPIILNIKKKPTFNDDDAQDESMKILEYEERKQLSKSLSLFTMFIWLFTSIIATKF